MKFGKTPDGKYEIRQLCKDTLEGGMEVMRKAFFMDETVSIACELHRNPEAVKELEAICLHAAKQGVSLIAVELETGQVAAAAFNIFEAKDDDDLQYFADMQTACSTPAARCLLQFMVDMGNAYDVFEHYAVDTLIEIMFAATLREHRGHGLAKLLFRSTLELAAALRAGTDARVSIGPVLPAEYPRPQLVTALCSSFVTQKLALDMGFERVHMVDFGTWSFNGRTFAESIGPTTKGTSVDCYVLK